MSQVSFSPPFTPPSEAASQLRQNGYAVLAPAAVAQWMGCDLSALMGLNGDWAALPSDDFLKDGGRYRRRRHACFVVQGREVQQVPHRAHWQPVEYNALHGGMERWFAPMEPATVAQPVWQRLLAALAQVSDAVFAGPSAPAPWFVEAHQFRIDTTDGIGRPTPEGAHRDGVDLVAVFLVGREGVKGGETLQGGGRKGGAADVGRMSREVADLAVCVKEAGFFGALRPVWSGSRRGARTARRRREPDDFQCRRCRKLAAAGRRSL